MAKQLLYLLGIIGCAFLGGAAVNTVAPRLAIPAAAQPAPMQPGGGAGKDVAAALEERFEAVARAVSPAVVAVESSRPARPGASGKGRAVEDSGSGVITRIDGRAGYFVLTNNHVVAGAQPGQITVHLADGRVFRPARVWTDPESDVAVLGIETSVKLPTAPLGDSDRMRVGHWVLAMGSPFGLNQTVTHGIISARDRGQVSLGTTIRIKDFLQTDAAINPGSSGGPLVDLRGEVIGINTAIASQSGSSSGVGFSIPSNLARRVARELLEKGVVSRGYLGMQLTQGFEPADALRLGLERVRGALVEQVYPDTPAAAAGLRGNDVILQVENVAVRNETHLINLISTLPPGQRVRLQVWRERRAVTVEAVVGDWSKEQGRFRGR
ncbi:MAG: trypsin-like peptidase domain-containing protein [Gemmataceae bacterium]|nr:trypsin-like peptidase domain-containing protein [Gemmataceae bacterium]